MSLRDAAEAAGMIVSGVASAALLAVSEEAIERTIEWTEDD